MDELELEGEVEVTESEEELRATVEGEDLGLLIGKHGTTIDALQHLAMRVALRGDRDDHRRVVVDAAGYRARRENALQREADRAVADALRYGRPVELEPMRRARAQGRAHLPERAHRHRDLQRGRRARPPARGRAAARLAGDP